MPASERHRVLAASPQPPPGGAAFRTADQGCAAMLRWKKAAQRLRETLTAHPRVAPPESVGFDELRAILAAAPSDDGIPPCWHPAEGVAVSGTARELAVAARRHAVESLVASRSLVNRSETLLAELATIDSRPDASIRPWQPPLLLLAIGFSAFLLVLAGIPLLLVLVLGAVLIAIGMHYVFRRSASPARASERRQSLAAAATGVTADIRNALSGFAQGRISTRELWQAVDAASSPASPAMNSAPDDSMARERVAFVTFRNHCEEICRSLLHDEWNRIRTEAASRLDTRERAFAEASERHSRREAALADACRAFHEEAGRACATLAEVPGRVRAIREFVDDRLQQLRRVAAGAHRHAEALLAETAPQLRDGCERLSAARSGVTAGLSAATAEARAGLDVLAARARDSAGGTPQALADLSQIALGRIGGVRYRVLGRDRELRDEFGPLAGRLCDETIARKSRSLEELRRRLEGIRGPLLRIHEERKWSLAVAAPGGAAFERMGSFFGDSSAVGRVRALRYRHRDLLRLGTSHASVPESGLAACPLLLQLNEASPDRPPRRDVVPIRNERSILVMGDAQVPVEVADRLVRQLAIRTLGLRSPGLVQLMVIDPIHSGASFREASQLQGICFERVNLATDPQSIEAMLRRLRESMTTTILETSSTGDLSLDASLARSASGSTPFRTLCVFGFPCGFDERSIAELEQICRAGDQAGIHVLVSLHLDRLAALAHASPKAIRMDRFNDVVAWVQVKDPDLRLARLVNGGGAERGGLEIPFTLDPPFSPGEVEQIVRTVRHDHEVRDVVRLPPIAAAEALGALPAEPAREVALMLGTCRDDPIRPAIIPFGRDIAHHALLVGTTGSGKTRLLQGIVATACLRYRPDELQFWLLDFKSGTGFKPFATAGLPHCRVIGLSSDVTYGLDALKRLLDEMRERQLLFRRHSVENLEQYASLRTRPGGPERPLPRIVAVIDEFQTLFGRETATAARVRMAEIVQKGRSAGIHLFLATQSLEGQAADIDSLRSQIRVNVILQSTASTQRGVLDRDEYTDVHRIRRYEGLLDVNGLRTDFDVLDMADSPDRINPHLADALEAASRASPVGEPPLVYDGDGEVPLPSAEEFGRLALLVRERRRLEGVPVVMGMPAAVTDLPAFAELRAAMNGNVIVSGVDDRQVETQLAAAILSIRGCLGPGSVEIDLLQADRMGRAWRSLERRFPPDVALRRIPAAEVNEFLERTAEGIEGWGGTRRRIILVREWTILKAFADFGARGAEHVEAILAKGPLVGVHVLAATASGRRLPADVRDYHAVRVASAASQELARADGFNPSATTRMFIEDPERPESCVEYLPYTHREESSDA
jgi:hypothetical protein